GSTAFSSSLAVPLPTGVSDGQTAFIALMYNGSSTTTVSASGWTRIAQANNGSDTFMDVFQGAVSGGQTTETITLGANRDMSAVSCTTDGSTIGTVGEFNGTSGSGLTTAPAVVMAEGGMKLAFICFDNRSGSLVCTPTAALTHQPNDKSSAKTAAIVAVEDEAAGAGTTISATHPFNTSCAITIPVNA
ncbi:MAG: hypothetical protein AAGB04_30115, partial [Pseudomonadota bacterium]